jgi:hypothetical protein
MIDVLLEPVKFFEKTRERPPRPWLGYLVVLLTSLLTGLASQLATRELSSPPTFGPNWLWMLIGIVLGSLIMWGLFGFIFHLVTGLGARAFELAGWAFAPGVVMGLLLLAVAALFPIQGNLPPPPADPGHLRDWLHAYQAAVRASTYTQVSRWAGLLSVLWSAWIVYAGGRVFAEKRAVLLVVVFLVIEALFMIPGFFFS